MKYCKAVLPCDVPAVLAIPIPYLHRLNQNTGLKPRAVVYLVKLCQDEFAQWSHTKYEYNTIYAPFFSILFLQAGTSFRPNHT